MRLFGYAMYGVVLGGLLGNIVFFPDQVNGLMMLTTLGYVLAIRFLMRKYLED